ncbi:hypothetical protein [Roseisolibacter sp. H3M3-2]|uniref:hypothetical protein n=1 Tax=Roseisolibacter sp. H3M3-2 TaxID=3031323 RepID=UPI0023DC3FB8|nr:hypothetical protein [Roseisolibacter sp. H3M3-2]MDF1503469.1 hypothetical protein [Roseisolibacter sp. H3M3-2]
MRRPLLALLPALALLASPAAPAGAQRQTRAPLLTFPEPGLDDTAAYRGYRTRLWQDAAGNTLQVYLDGREGRVVHLWADAENESLGLSARDAGDRPAALRWDGATATVTRAGAARSVEYRVAADLPELRLGWFLLGSMRVERDFQYWKKHRAPFTDPPFRLEEEERLFAALDRLPAGTRRAHLAPLGVADVAALRQRVEPVVTAGPEGARWVARVVRRTLDGRDSLMLEVVTDPARVEASRQGAAVALRARDGRTVPLTLRVTTTGAALTPLTRAEIFTPAFTAFAAQQARLPGEAARLRARRTERQMRGVEALASRDKLMAGLPTYATYFGRDQLVSALMMRPIWKEAVPAAVIASVLRKLSPDGEVSHEEALGGQAVREAAAEYAALVDSALGAGAAGSARSDSLLARAAAVLRDHRRVRENYHMIDDELQLPVLAARWLADSTIPAARRRAFLADSADGGGSRAARLLRELALVARMTAPYAARPEPANLVGFARRDATRWGALSWRDSGVGYANGRYAMDVNAIWAPHALEAVATILDAMGRLGFARDSLLRASPALAAGTPLGDWARDPGALRAAAETWWGASRHFLVSLPADTVRARVAARLVAMPEAERAHWRGVHARPGADRAPLEFLALSLDEQGRPIGVANSDPSTRLFLGESLLRRGAPDPAARAAVLRDVRLFARAYPVGLLVGGVGPVVANDAYAPPPVWAMFEDLYHSPRAVWGREVNLFLLGVAHHVRLAGGPSPRDAASRAYVRELLDAAAAVERAVEASGFHSELWSYDFPGGRLTPVRYGSGADVQLWSTTDLAVRYALRGLLR